MLERKLPEIYAPPESETDQAVDPRAMIAAAALFVRRNFLIGAAVFVACLLCGFGYLKVAKPRYTAVASLYLTKEEARVSVRDDVQPPRVLDVYGLESQMAILRSDSLVRAVVSRLKLDEDPEFGGSSDGVVHSLFSLFAPQAAPDDAQQFELATETVERNLEVSRVGMSFLVEVSYSSASPEKSALIANTIADEFIAEQRQKKLEDQRASGQWFGDRADQLSQQAEAAERAVLEFKQENKIVTVEGNLLNEKQVADLSTQVATARQQSDEARNRLDRISAIDVSDPALNPVDATAPIDSFASPSLKTLKEHYLELSTQQADYARKFGENSGAVAGMRAQIGELRTTILGEVRRLAQAVKGDQEAAAQNLAALEKQLAAAIDAQQAANRAQITLQELDSRAHTSRELYNAFVERSQESSQAESFPLNDARIVSPARPPREKSGPKSMVILALSVASGLVLGLGAGLARDLFDDTLRTGNRVQELIRLPCVALVPRQKGSRRARSLPAPDRAVVRERTIPKGGQLFWGAVDRPTSRFAEAFRSIKLALDLAYPSREHGKVVGFSSALPGEGKTSTSAGFGLLAARAGWRAIIVDLDLRNPMLSNMMAPHASAGLVEVLAGECPLEKAIWSDPNSGVDFLPAGGRSRVSHSNEIVASVAIRRLFYALSMTYDYVVADLPPLVPVVDTRATTAFVDAYFLVVEWGATKASLILKALDAATEVRERVLGVILNKSNVQSLPLYDDLAKTYYVNPDFKRYGYTD